MLPVPSYKFDTYYYLTEATYRKTAEATKYLAKKLPNFRALTPKHLSQWKICAFVDEANQSLVIGCRGTNNLLNVLGDVRHQFWEPEKLLEGMEEYIRSVEAETGLKVSSILGHSEGGYFACRLLKGSTIERVTLNAHKALEGVGTYNFRISHDLVSKGPLSHRYRYLLIESANHDKCQGHGLKAYKEFLGLDWEEIAPGTFEVTSSTPIQALEDLGLEEDGDTLIVEDKDVLPDTEDGNQAAVPAEETPSVGWFDGVAGTFASYFITTALVSYVFSRVFPSKNDAKKSNGEKVWEAAKEGAEKGGVAAVGQIIMNGAIRGGYLALTAAGIGVGIIVKVFSDTKEYIYRKPIMLPDSASIARQVLATSREFSSADRAQIAALSSLSLKNLDTLDEHTMHCSAEELLEGERLLVQSRISGLRKRIQS